MITLEPQLALERGRPLRKMPIPVLSEELR